MHHIKEEDETIIEDYEFTILVAKWKKEFNNIKEIDITEKQSITFYLEIIEG